MFLFQRKSEAINYRPKNFQQLSNPVKSLRFINELEKDIVDRPSDVGSKIQELAINPMKSRFEEIPFTGIL